MSELYELPNGWEWTSIGKTVLKTENMNPLAEPKVYFTYIDISSIDNQLYCIKEPKYLIGSDAPSRAKKKIKKGDIVFATTRPSLKNIAIVNSDYENPIASTGFCVLRANQSIHFKYLFNYLLTKDLGEQIESKIRGAQYPAVSDKDLMNCDIPLPPLLEQQQIVSKLDLLFQKIDKSIELHQKNIDESNAFIGSVLNDIFVEMDGQHKKEKLEKFDKKMSAGGTPLRAKNEYWNNGTIEWFSSGELNQQFTLPAKERITDEGLKNSSAKLFSKGTLLIGMYDTAAMKMSMLHTNASCNQAIVGIKPNEDELNIFFLKYQLEYLKPKILEERQGVRQQNLNLSKIKNVMIEFPPLQIQQKVVEYLDSVSEKMEKVKSIQKEKMKSLKALKSSILDKAFRGEL